MSRIRNVLEYLENSAKRFPDKIAFADEAAEMTYSQVLSAARRMGTSIARRVPPRTPVAVLGPKNAHTAGQMRCVFEANGSEATGQARRHGFGRRPCGSALK